MKTTFDRRSPRSARRFAAKQACWTISAEVMFLRKPAAPVAQNPHRSGHPTWEEMHRVRRLSSGIRTLSTASPSSSRKRNFSVPSAEVSTRSAGKPEMRHDAARIPRSSFDRSVIAAKSPACFW